ncbi:MAG: hypothetical protein ACREXS_04220 [Gammaproteobacteria bacterium]
MLLGLAGMTNAMALMLPGIPESGSPNFVNSARVEVKSFNSPFSDDGFSLLTARQRTGPFLFRPDSGQEFGVKNADFTTFALFDDDGALERGFVTITGRIPGLFGTGNPAFGNPSGLLYFADLVDFSFSDSLLGFETANALGWASQFQTGPESLYFSSLSRPFPGADDFRQWSANATALTTVPLPGAVYLLGSALAGLFFGAPKRKAGAL